jgi:flagellar basal-body rod protein FlgB
MQIFDRTTLLLEKALGLRLVRHNLIAANLANMDTPGYEARDISFADELRQAMERPPVKLSSLSLEPPAPLVRGEGKVDLDREMARLAENSLMHDAMSRLISKKFELLKYAIGEGGK